MESNQRPYISTKAETDSSSDDEADMMDLGSTGSATRRHDVAIESQQTCNTIPHAMNVKPISGLGTFDRRCPEMTQLSNVTPTGHQSCEESTPSGTYPRVKIRRKLTPPSPRLLQHLASLQLSKKRGQSEGSLGVSEQMPVDDQMDEQSSHIQNPKKKIRLSLEPRCCENFHYKLVRRGDSCDCFSGKKMFWITAQFNNCPIYYEQPDDIKPEDHHQTKAPKQHKSWVPTGPGTRESMPSTSRKPFQCQNCDKAFDLQNDLTMHSFSHLRVKPFKCRVCGQIFSTYHSLSAHLAEHNQA